MKAKGVRGSGYYAVMREAARKYLLAKLAEHGNNVSAAARDSGINRTHFHKLLSRHGIPLRHPRRANWDRPIPKDW